MKKSFKNWEVLDNLDDEVIAYQKKHSAETLNQLWEKISEFVRFYPRLAFRQTNEDDASDFYIYVFEKKKTLFDKFDINLSSFRSFLSLRLRSHYLNFIVRNRKINKKNRIVYSEREDLFSETYEKKHTEVLSSSGSDTSTLRETEEHEVKADSFFPEYEKDPLKYLVLKLYYLDFFGEDDFVRLKEYTGKKYTEILKMLDQLRDEVVDKKRRCLKADEKLNTLYLDLLICQEKLNLNEEKGDEHQKKINLTRELNHKRNRILESYYRISVFSSLKNVAHILSVNETKVANILVYQRKVMEKKLYSLSR